VTPFFATTIDGAGFACQPLDFAVKLHFAQVHCLCQTPAVESCAANEFPDAETVFCEEKHPTS
jgi:hypothetical protein